MKVWGFMSDHQNNITFIKNTTQIMSMAESNVASKKLQSLPLKSLALWFLVSLCISKAIHAITYSLFYYGYLNYTIEETFEHLIFKFFLHISASESILTILLLCLIAYTKFGLLKSRITLIKYTWYSYICTHVVIIILFIFTIYENPYENLHRFFYSFVKEYDFAFLTVYILVWIILLTISGLSLDYYFYANEKIFSKVGILEKIENLDFEKRAEWANLLKWTILALFISLFAVIILSVIDIELLIFKIVYFLILITKLTLIYSYVKIYPDILRVRYDLDKFLSSGSLDSIHLQDGIKTLHRILRLHMKHRQETDFLVKLTGLLTYYNHLRNLISEKIKKIVEYIDNGCTFEELLDAYTSLFKFVTFQSKKHLDMPLIYPRRIDLILSSLQQLFQRTSNFLIRIVIISGIYILLSILGYQQFLFALIQS